jgi:3'(2'), 5'-bisphosphate nucleotidase
MFDESTVVSIAINAGNAIMQFYDEPIEVEHKSDDSPLTKADLAAHHVIVDGLKTESPDVSIISEEGGIADYPERKEWSRYWLVDPLDGTKEFIKKNGEFTVNIALIENNIPVFGVVHIPATGVTYVGHKSEGSFKIDKNGNRQKIYSETPDLSKPVRVVCSRSHGSSDMERVLAEKGIEIGEQVPAGSSLKFCLLAEGKADVYPRLGPTMEWDTGAGDAVFRYSSKKGTRHSPIVYNKENMLNDGFIIGHE